MVSEAMVRRIQEAVKEAARATQRRDKLVRQAREQGATWTQIGFALGVSAQAAQQKYGDTGERVEAYQERLKARREKREKRGSVGGAE